MIKQLFVYWFPKGADDSAHCFPLMSCGFPWFPLIPRDLRWFSYFWITSKRNFWFRMISYRFSKGSHWFPKGSQQFLWFLQMFAYFLFKSVIVRRDFQRILPELRRIRATFQISLFFAESQRNEQDKFAKCCWKIRGQAGWLKNYPPPLRLVKNPLATV